MPSRHGDKLCRLYQGLPVSWLPGKSEIGSYGEETGGQEESKMGCWTPLPVFLAANQQGCALLLKQTLPSHFQKLPTAVHSLSRFTPLLLLSLLPSDPTNMRVLSVTYHRGWPSLLAPLHPAYICLVIKGYIKDATWFPVETPAGYSSVGDISHNLWICISCMENHSPPDPSVRGIIQARILEWIAISFSTESSQPMDRTQVSCIAGRLSSQPPGKLMYMENYIIYKQW